MFSWICMSEHSTCRMAIFGMWMFSGHFNKHINQSMNQCHDCTCRSHEQLVRWTFITSGFVELHPFGVYFLGATKYNSNVKSNANTSTWKLHGPAQTEKTSISIRTFFLHVSTGKAVVGRQRRIVKTPVVQVIVGGVNVPAWRQMSILILKLKCQTNWWRDWSKGGIVSQIPSNLIDA